LDQAQRPHDGRECIGNGRHFDGVVSAACCHLRFTLDSGICRTLDLASSVCASLIQIRTPIEPNRALPTRLAGVMTNSQHVYEVRPRKDHRGVDLISDALPDDAFVQVCSQR
jgi:hypothetical protein